jgi:hypothetical protein
MNTSKAQLKSLALQTNTRAPHMALILARVMRFLNFIAFYLNCKPFETASMPIAFAMLAPKRFANRSTTVSW